MPATATFAFGNVRVYQTGHFTYTHFPDGLQLVAAHSDVDQQGQDATARDLGYASVEAMNMDHDVCHSVLAFWLGLSCSPTLYARARGTTVAPFWQEEEAAVLAIQRLTQALGLDVRAIARGWSGV